MVLLIHFVELASLAIRRNLWLSRADTESQGERDEKRRATFPGERPKGVEEILLEAVHRVSRCRGLLACLVGATSRKGLRFAAV